MAILNPDRLEYSISRFEPFPPSGCRSDRNAACHVQSYRLARLSLDFRQKIDGVGLQSRHVWIRIERMHSAGGMP